MHVPGTRKYAQIFLFHNAFAMQLALLKAQFSTDNSKQATRVSRHFRFSACSVCLKFFRPQDQLGIIKVYGFCKMNFKFLK